MGGGGEHRQVAEGGGHRQVAEGGEHQKVAEGGGHRQVARGEHQLGGEPQQLEGGQSKIIKLLEGNFEKDI